MKKIFLFLSLLLLSFTGTAQDFGKWLLTGSASYSVNKTEYANGSESKNSSYSISPKIGYFVSPRIAVGLSFGYGGTTGSQAVIFGYGLNDYYTGGDFTPGYIPNSDYVPFRAEYSTTSFSGGPFVRYYQPIAGNAAFFGQLSGNYRREETSFADYPNYYRPDVTTKVVGGYLSPGFVFFPTQRIGFEVMMGSIGYSTLESTSERAADSGKSKSFSASLGLESLSLGVSIYLGRTATPE